MNSTDNGRGEARSRANRRLRRMTIGTTMLGVAATGSLGLLAAATYDGASGSGNETAIVSSASGDSAAATSTTTTQSTTAAATAAPTVSTTTGSAHASSGGS
jgi:hypothetical protein